MSMLKFVISIHRKTRSTIRKITCRYLVTDAGYQKSFQYRILNYFENVYKDSSALRKYEISSQIRKDLLESNGIQEKLNLIYQLIHDLSNNKKTVQCEERVNDFDELCCAIINSLNYAEILNLLTLLLKVIPNRLTETKFYKKSLFLLSEGTEYELLSDHEILQLFFFISLKKEESASHIKYFKPHLPDIKKMPLIEKCILATCFYKSSVKMPPLQSRIFENTIEEEIEQLIVDPPLLVSLCKIVRISGPSNEINFEKLSEAIINMKEPLQFTNIVHILSLYAEALLFEPKAVDRLVKDSIQQIREDSYKPILRIKDFDRFLWSVSRLRLTLAQNEKEIFKTYIELRINEYKKKGNIGTFVNSILFLHMLDCSNIKVIEYCFKERIFEPIFYDRFHWKIRSRLQLLLSQINIELNVTIPQALKKQIPFAFTPSKNIESIAEVAKSLVDKEIFKDAVLECPISNLQIPGVTLMAENNTYHVDVLDNSTCLRNTKIPHGLMNLKLRLLSQLKYQSFLISGDIFNEDPVVIQCAIEQHIMENIKN